MRADSCGRGGVETLQAQPRHYVDHRFAARPENHYATSIAPRLAADQTAHGLGLTPVAAAPPVQPQTDRGALPSQWRVRGRVLQRTAALRSNLPHAHGPSPPLFYRAQNSRDCQFRNGLPCAAHHIAAEVSQALERLHLREWLKDLPSF